MGEDAGTNCAALFCAKDKSAIPKASVLSDTNGRKFPYMILPQMGMLVERGDGESCATRKVRWGRGNRGIAYPAVAGASFSGPYGLSFTQTFFGSEADGTGQMKVDATSHTLSGVVDTNSSFFAQPNTALTGSLQTTAISGRLTGTLSNKIFPSDLAVAYYLIDSSNGFFVETDSLNTANLSLGYFAGRVPVCQGCP